MTIRTRFEHTLPIIALFVATILPIQAENAPAFSWQRGDSSLALLAGENVVWRLDTDPEKPKSHFHPLATVEGRVLTALEPADHPWHRGLWWSWKYINGVNYWEENRDTGRSAGHTRLVGAKIEAADDFSASADLEILYHPAGQDPVLAEMRHIAVSRPDAEGVYLEPVPKVAIG